ncbi:MAG: carbamoyltransferase HypF [Candidatus Ornithomonoglobus sp.]
MTEKYIISGLVQGIGFRPSVKRAAEKYGIQGTVKNTGGAVEVLAQGTPTALDRFRAEIRTIPQAVITGFTEEQIEDLDCRGFEIIESGIASREIPMLTPDIAVCDRCLAEFSEPENRRFMHPFISCTDCGPRYSVLQDIPYDRCNITMSDFEMCGECESEYRDIKNIRCHAQTIACNECGPALSYTVYGDPLTEAARTINGGGAVAVKDIGGYHFACSALSDSAAAGVRRIKQREAKPFAVMFNSIDEIYKYARVSQAERDVLMSAARPVVLLKKKRDLAPNVCSESDYIGAFLPCNPVQYYLTRECGPLVMTSANISGEPIITDNNTMFRLLERMGGFEILSHNRRILTPLDDSVCRVICGRVQMIRRARGYTPLPIKINSRRDIKLLAAGGDLKAAFCYAADGRAYMSQYFGDLENAGVYGVWKKNIARLGGLLGMQDAAFICDMHPGYHSAEYAKSRTLQHHFAHMASVMAEHKLQGSALGFIFDGTGYGEDGCIWGGEVIFYDNGFKRIASLEYTELLGGDEAAKSSEMTLDCFLISAGLKPQSENAALIKAALQNHINTVQSSSMGRLFDAVSALLGISGYNSYEGESAILLESVAAKAKTAYSLKLQMTDGKWRTSQLIHDISSAYDNGADKSSLALGFHKAIADAVCDYAKNQNEKNIILSGGVFSNRLLTELCFDKLTKWGYNVYINEQVPCNDGGIALGQTWYMLNE